MSSDRIAARLKDIVVETALAQAFMERIAEADFRQDAFAIRSMTRHVEIVCEAAVHIEQAVGSKEAATLLPSIGIRVLKDMGNLIRHRYQHVQQDVVWQTAKDDFPRLSRDAKQALSRFPSAASILSLPTILAAPGLLHDALADTGFVVVTDHGIDLSRLHAAYGSVQAFFALPEEDKRRFMVGTDGQRGYTPFGREHAKDASAPDLKEFWHVGRDAIAPNVWPDTPEGFEREVAWLYEALDALGLTLLRSLTGPLDVPIDTFDEMAAGGNSVLRLLHYPPLAADADPRSIRAAAHEDINLITLLVSASSAGLELKDRAGDWHAIDAPADSVIVDSGDMLARITNGRLPATTHRVVNPEGPNTSRYSMPFFLHPRPDAVLSVFDQFRDGNEAPDITGQAFLAERLSQIGLA